MTKSEETALKKELMKDLKAFIETSIEKEMKSKMTEKEVKKIFIKSLTNFFRTLWTRQSTWSQGI